MSDVSSRVREIVAGCGEFAVDVRQLKDSSDLYAAGLSSFASVQIMLAIEEAFDVEFPDSLLNRRTFQSIESIAAAVEGILSEAVGQ